MKVKLNVDIVTLRLPDRYFPGATVAECHDGQTIDKT